MKARLDFMESSRLFRRNAANFPLAFFPKVYYTI